MLRSCARARVTDDIKTTFCVSARRRLSAQCGKKQNKPYFTVCMKLQNARSLCSLKGAVHEHHCGFVRRFRGKMTYSIGESKTA